MTRLPHRVLILAEDWPLCRDSPGGAAALNLSHLELLADCVEELHLLILSDPRDGKGWERFLDEDPRAWRQVEALCSSCKTIRLRPRTGSAATLKNAVVGLRDPSRLLIDLQAETSILIQQHVHAVRPDLIWAEHLVPATLVDRYLPGIPWIYSHHDWNWRIKRHRQPPRDVGVKHRLKRSARGQLRRRFEESLVQRATACVSGSITEGDTIRRLGSPLVGYFPASFEPKASRRDLTRASGQPRLVHLGGLRTTATRLGLERFLSIVWPDLLSRLDAPPEFWVIGSLDGASAALRQELEAVGAICPGFVPDLDAVLRPGDLHILPWEHDTGTRTRVPLVLSYAQVLVAVRKGVACLDELRDGENCRMVNRLGDMGLALAELLGQGGTRRRLARAGLKTLREEFSRSAQQSRMVTFLERFMDLVATRRS